MLMNGLRLVHGFFIAHLCLSPPYSSIVPWYVWRTCGEMAECAVGRTVKAMIGCTKQVVRSRGGTSACLDSCRPRPLTVRFLECRAAGQGRARPYDLLR